MTEGLVTEFLINNVSRTGIDLDDASELEFLKAYYNAKHMFPDNEVRAYKSSGGDGYHIEIVGVKSRLSIRRTLGDCADRIKYAILRSSTVYGYDELSIGDPIVDDVLFSCKSRVFCGTKYTRRHTQQRVRLDHKSVIAQGFWV